MARKRLLVAEDEELLREVLSSFFEARGFEVARARSLAEAERHLVAGSFDAAIVDVGLPDGDGLTLIARADPSRSVVISARPDERRYARFGVRHHLAKPLDLPELAELVSSLADSPA